MIMPRADHTGVTDQGVSKRVAVDNDREDVEALVANIQVEEFA